MSSVLEDQNDVEVVKGISAWYLPTNDDIIKNNPGMPHETYSKVTVEYLNSLGVISTNLNNPTEWQNDDGLTKIRDERGYRSCDEVVFNEPLKNDDKDRFFGEHLHSDEKSMFLSHGVAYYDIRDTNDKWIRIMMDPGVLIVITITISRRTIASIMVF